MLLQPVKRQLRVVDVDLHGVLHELLAHGAHVGRERRGEHHHLLLVRRVLEDLLHVLAHVELLEHLVALVEDEVLDVRRDEVAVADQLEHAAGRAHDDVRRLRLEDALVLRGGHAAVEDLGLHVGQVAREALELVGDLVGELARVAQDDGADLRLLGLELVQRGEHEDCGLAHARLGLAEHVHPEDRLRYALVLHLARVLEAAVDDGAQQLGLEEEVAEAGRVDARVRAAPGEARAGRKQSSSVGWS